MAQPSTELITFRNRATAFLNQLNDINDVLNVIDGAGANDVERLAFFQTYIDAQGGNYDITIAQLTAAVLKLRELRIWIDTNLPALAKMRI